LALLILGIDLSPLVESRQFIPKACQGCLVVDVAIM
jgi:hypothetical protein